MVKELYDIPMEQLVLGCMMTDAGSAEKALETLVDRDFYDEAHKLIFRAITDVVSRGQSVSMATVASRLNEKEILDAAGGFKYLGELASGATSAWDIKSYIKVVREKADRRRLADAMEKAKESIYDPDIPIENIIGDQEQQMMDIQQSRNTVDVTWIHDVAVKAMDDMEYRMSNKGEVIGVPSGFADLDRMTAGFQKGDLIIVGARPSMGKSAFGLNIVSHAARKGYACAVFSLEMSTISLFNRMWSSEANAKSDGMRTGYLSDEDARNLFEAMGPLSELPIAFSDKPGTTVQEIRTVCRKIKATRGLDLVLVDYLQLITGRSRESRQVEISEISRGLKALARELNCPVIALSQLGRTPEQRGEHRPMLSDLRESGAIEQDADVVIFLYRDEYYYPNSKDKGIAEVIVSKQRNGSTGTVKLAFLADYTKFANYGGM